MGTDVELAIAVLLPTAVGYFIVASLYGARWGSERWNVRRYRQQAKPEPAERLEARLRRLRTELDATEIHSGLTAKGARLKALRGAYVDVLSDACGRFDVPPPPGGERAPQAEIYRVEAALRQHGLDVREPAVH
ncbi:MAG: hypothetical protein ACRDNF_07155 [Streptosporangiaceae bacterium]